MKNSKVNRSDITIESIEITDAKDIFEIYSDANVCKYYDIEPFKEISQAIKHIEKWLQAEEEKKQFRHSIKYNNEIVGTCGIYSIYRHQQRACIGYDLKKEYWNMRIMTIALSKFIPMVKDLYHINRLQALVDKENFASKKILLNSGFDHEGTLKQYEYWHSRGFVDLEMYAKIL